MYLVCLVPGQPVRCVSMVWVGERGADSGLAFLMRMSILPSSWIELWIAASTSCCFLRLRIGR